MSVRWKTFVNSIMLKTVSFEIRPYNRGHAYWAKLIRAGGNLPFPALVNGASEIPGKYLMHGEEELFPNDILFEGQANHRSKSRGWRYWVHFVNENGDLIQPHGAWSVFKSRLKEAAGTYDAELLKGAGDLAACVRWAHIQRAGGLDTLLAISQALEAKSVMQRIVKRVGQEGIGGL